MLKEEASQMSGEIAVERLENEGGPVKPEPDGASYQSVNPYNGEILKTFEQHTDQELETALATAATCFESWRHKTFAERALIAAQ